MMGYHFLMLTLAASVCARLPATDLVVPEKLDFAAHTTADSFIQAMTKSGGTEADCRSFATTTIASIKAEVTSEQGLLNAVDTGSGCAQEGQTLVSSTQVTLTAAQADLVAKQDTAASALSTKNTACSASVAFAVNLDTLQAKTCYDYTSEATYISAMTECGSATTALTKADQAVATATTAVSDAQTAYNAAVAEAARLKSACHCRVQREQATAWTAASAATAAHAADWKQAHKVICALNRTTTCPVPTCPTVTQPAAANGVDAEISYVEHAEQACHGRNELFKGTDSLAGCKKRCTNAPTCVSIEFKSAGTSCRVSSSCQGSYIVPYPRFDVWTQERNTVCQTPCTNQEVISYVKHAEQACHGRNELFKGTDSLAGCKKRCTNAPTCVSIEFRPASTSCRVSSSCQGSYIVPYPRFDVWTQERNTVCQTL